MPLSEAFLTDLSDPAFWARFFFEEAGETDDADTESEDEDGEDRDGDDECVIPFMLDEKHGLRLGIDLANEYHDLSLVAPGLSEPAEIGWDDQAHWHPHVLRWDELDLLCRALAVGDASFAHPGAPLALLCRFTFLSGGEDLDAITPLVDAAFQRFRPERVDGYWPTARDWLDPHDLRGMGVSWRWHEDGVWTVGQQGDHPMDLYSLRAVPEGEPRSEEAFPFTAWAAVLDRSHEVLAEAVDRPWRNAPEVRRVLRQIIDDAELSHAPELARALQNAGCDRTTLLAPLVAGAPVPASPAGSPVPAEQCWIIEELAGLERGALISRCFGTSPLASARTFGLRLDIDIFRRPFRYDRDICAELDRQLRDNDLGFAEITGGSTARNRAGEYAGATSVIEILIRDDLEEAVALIADVLHRHGAPAETRLVQERPSPEEIAWARRQPELP